MTTDRLIEAVWGHDPPVSVRASLQSHVSRLRTGLREVGGDRERIVTRGGGYALEPADGDDIDAAAFERETDRAHRLLEEDPRAALELLEDGARGTCVSTRCWRSAATTPRWPSSRAGWSSSPTTSGWPAS